ncbi:hypothetical protein KPH14_012383 [Odynerus spinipes]|uniref:Gustatory receptor n=1 Tax=Odynerus spinipes TaxID=1348599 RepID=A0AAD9RIJ4_9HYME|nr:hypothetical protein KPH14_012383 [Odynerus spinipes]
MLGIQLFLIFLIGLLTILSKSSGYLMDRSGNLSQQKKFINFSKYTFFVVGLWNVPPSLNSVQNMSHEQVLNDNTHATKMKTITGEKKDIKRFERTASKESPRKRRFETGSSSTEDFFVTGHKTSSLKTNSSSSHLRNVILVVVDTVMQEREEFWKNFERVYSFPVHGYHQVNNYDKNSPMKVDLNDFRFPGRKEDECKCKETLRSNIHELLTWARQVPKMTTSILSALNLSISGTPELEETLETMENNESNESSTKGTIRKRQLQQNISMRFLDTYDRNNSDLPKIMMSNANKEIVKNYDDMWDVLDMFTKIKIAFFRAMIDSLSDPSNGTMDDELSFEELSRSRIVFVNLVDDALKKLERASSDEGYLLVLVVSENELDPVIDLLHHQISLSDTLLIVTEICSKETSRVSFFATGPEASTFYHTRAIGDLADAIKSAKGRACQERGCNKNRHHPRGFPIRIIRNMVNSQNMTALNSNVGNNSDSISSGIFNNWVGRMDVSSSSNPMYDNFTTFLGMATSLIALITINSA